MLLYPLLSLLPLSIAKGTTKPIQTIRPHLVTVPRPNSREPYLASSTTFLNRSFFILLDGSGSMANSGCFQDTAKGEASRRAIMSWVKMLAKGDFVALWAMDRTSDSQRTPFLAASSQEQLDHFITALSEIHWGGGSQFNGGLPVIADQLDSNYSRQNGYGEHHLIIVTDHFDYQTSAFYSDLSAIAPDNLIQFHVIDLCPPTDGTHHPEFDDLIWRHSIRGLAATAAIEQVLLQISETDP